jgi:hypothetical protein
MKELVLGLLSCFVLHVAAPVFAADKAEDGAKKEAKKKAKKSKKGGKKNTDKAEK